MSVVLLSGGMDSTALAAQITQAHGPDNTLALSVDYGQRHSRELDAASRVAHHLGTAHRILDLSSLGAHLRSALTPASSGPAVPHGHYTAHTMAATVVPNRNAILLMAAAGIAQATGHTTVATAVHSGDHPVYPDCRPEFIDVADAAARAGTGGAVSITAPFVSATKADIARIGHHAAAPFHLSWSCYEGGDIHCGRCGTCVERAEAFHLAAVPDPTDYADTAFWKTAT